MNARNIAEQLSDEVSWINEMLCRMSDSRSLFSYDSLQQIYIMKVREQEAWEELKAIISSMLY